MGANPGDTHVPGGESAPDTSAVPDSFLTTIRVRRSGPGAFTATQRGVGVTGTGATPHRAIIDLVGTLEQDCFE